MITKARARAALLLTALFVITSCNANGSSGAASLASSSATTSPSSAGTSRSTALQPTEFTSETYGYAATLTAGWTGTQVLGKWDGRSEVSIYSPQVDAFGSGSAAGVFAVATHWNRDLRAYTKFLITYTCLFHSEFCPPVPTSRGRLTIGGQPGVLLAYNCGILINLAATVHGGVAYWFVFRDPGVAAATDPADHATFLKILRSARSPDGTGASSASASRASPPAFSRRSRLRRRGR
jgi:hypothetical protein